MKRNAIALPKVKKRIVEIRDKERTLKISYNENKKGYYSETHATTEANGKTVSTRYDHLLYDEGDSHIEKSWEYVDDKLMCEKVSVETKCEKGIKTVVTEITYSYSGDEATKESETFEYIVNHKGRLLRKKEFDSVYSYNEETRTGISYTRTDNGENMLVYVAVFDDYGNVLEEEEAGTITKYFYKGKGRNKRCVKAICTDKQTSKQRMFWNKYNKNGNIVQRTEIGPKGVYIFKNKYRDSLTVFESKEENGKLIYQMQNWYDSMRRPVKTINYCMYDMLAPSVSRYVYDKKGNFETTYHFMNGKLNQKNTVEYDDDGYPVRWYDENGALYRERVYEVISD